MCAETSKAKIVQKLEGLGIGENGLNEWKSRHVDWCIKLCGLQQEQGMYFVYEHFDKAQSWKSIQMQELLEREGVCRCRGVGYMGKGEWIRHKFKGNKGCVARTRV